MEGAKLANGKKTERTDSKPRRLLGKRPERKTKAEKLRPGLLPSPAPANLPHGGVLRENLPDLAIGRGLPFTSISTVFRTSPIFRCFH